MAHRLGDLSPSPDDVASKPGSGRSPTNLRANSNLASNEYFMPIVGLLFLRQATNRYYAAASGVLPMTTGLSPAT